MLMTVRSISKMKIKMNAKKQVKLKTSMSPFNSGHFGSMCLRFITNVNIQVSHLSLADLKTFKLKVNLLTKTIYEVLHQTLLYNTIEHVRSGLLPFEGNK